MKFALCVSLLVLGGEFAPFLHACWSAITTSVLHFATTYKVVELYFQHKFWIQILVIAGMLGVMVGRDEKM